MDEHAFPPTGFSVAWLGRSLHLVAAVGWWQLPERSCLTHVFPGQDSGRVFSEGKVVWRDSLPLKNTLVQRMSGILGACNMQISNSKLCESSKCWVYSAVNHPWWMSMLFHRRGLLWLGSAVRYKSIALQFRAILDIEHKITVNNINSRQKCQHLTTLGDRTFDSNSNGISHLIWPKYGDRTL